MAIATVEVRTPAVAEGAASWWRPPLGEVLFVALLFWVLVGGQPRALLADGDTGWHIRTGEYVLGERRVPTEDPYSFTRRGEPWFAWEWGSDVLLALVHRAAGLKGVVLLAGILIAATSAVLFEFLLWQRVNLVVAVVASMMAASASMVHWLARPHLFTCLLFVVSLWLLEADRRNPSRQVWAVVPLAALWANLHGGFAVLLGTLGVYWLGEAARTLRAGAPFDCRGVRRWGGLWAAAGAATLLNPYTWRLHWHIAGFLRSDFIRNQVEEFQSPRFRGESMGAFELLLIGGLVGIGWLWRQRDYATAMLVAGMAHAALGSVRHVPLYAAAATPVVARMASDALETLRGPWGMALASLARDLAPSRERAVRFRLPLAALAAVALAALLLDSGRARWRVDFPAEKFPQAALGAAEKKLVGRRVLTSDQWADYLIYRYYPRQRVYIDGRSDFYGPELGSEYLHLMQAGYRWEEVVERHGFDAALLPAGWPLATVLKSHPDWQLDYDDGQALVLSRARPYAIVSAKQATTH
jgi:hypothetical protein